MNGLEDLVTSSSYQFQARCQFVEALFIRLSLVFFLRVLFLRLRDLLVRISSLNAVLNTAGS